MKRVLISVSDKTGIVDFANKISKLGYEIISTGGTYNVIKDAGLDVIGISEITNFPECLDGRVKTLHPSIYAGLLAIRGNEKHMKQLSELGIDKIDMVVVNLYPFKETVLKPNVTKQEVIENIDIGGPTMIRAAAKNYQDVAVVIDFKDYNNIINEIKEDGDISINTKIYLATKVFMYTSHYDMLIANYMKNFVIEDDIKKFPDILSFTYEKIQNMRYGENPHQKAAFYKEINLNEGMLTNSFQIHGKELSYNNINDTNGALELLKEFEEPTIVACKHSNPCAVASDNNIYEAYVKAYNSDPVSIFGGIIASNREIDERTAIEINKIFVEIVIAPSFSKEALKILKQKKNIRLLTLNNISKKQSNNSLDIKKVLGGILIQEVNNKLINKDEIKYVTNKIPNEKEMEDILFAWKIVKHTKSNSIVISKNKQSIGIGVGQVNRIWACKQAIEHAIENFGKDFVKGSVVASDAFFPFSDCVEECSKVGITSIIQPGGSINDELSIEICNRENISMIFTNMRHFKH